MATRSGYTVALEVGGCRISYIPGMGYIYHGMRTMGNGKSQSRAMSHRNSHTYVHRKPKSRMNENTSLGAGALGTGEPGDCRGRQRERGLPPMGGVILRVTVCSTYVVTTGRARENGRLYDIFICMM